MYNAHWIHSLPYSKFIELTLFKDMRLEELMRNMARWYDVKVEFYREEAKDIVFTGDVKKYEDLNEVLEIIELTSDVHFTIEEQRIIVH